MSKNSRNNKEFGRQLRASGKLVALLASHGFGEQGPPHDATFEKAERFGQLSGFKAILDFSHVIKHLCEATRCSPAVADPRWNQHLGWRGFVVVAESSD